MDILKRFGNYVKIETTSNDESTTVPSTAIQMDLAVVLEKELKAMGVPKVMIADSGIVYGWLPASVGHEDAPALGLIAHMDTAPAASGKNVKMNIIENYDGKDVLLSKDVILSVKEFDHLPSLKGRTLVTTDGTTLLGADDKAGIAEIMTAIECVIKEELPHGPLCIAFTPDEEVGRGADHFDVDLFNAEYAYTVDGGAENIIAWETFNAAAVAVQIKGASVHPGSAFGVMKNAALIANEFIGMLPEDETPAKTRDYEGFYHLTEISGSVTEANLHFIIRDHNRDKFEYRKILMQEIEKDLNEKYGEGTVCVHMKDSYYNMSEILKDHKHLIDNALSVITELGMDAQTEPVRGGTDGARLSFMGLPCPNLGTGGYAFHGPYEHITKEGMENATKIILGLIQLYA